jgi:2-keto-3-deoxy-L-rhamnonate aldolase RhmA
MDKASILREKFKKGPFAIGGHVFLTDPSISEAMAYHGYDFIWIDAEHGPFDKERILSHIVAANAGGAAAIVRVVWNDPTIIKPILEMGPDGIIIPMVCSAQEAQKAVSACRYPPKGIRGFGPRRANKYGAQPLADYLENADASILKIVQIEHVDAVMEIEGIIAVEGLDAIIVGPNDLSASIGLLGDCTNTKVLALCDTVLSCCKNAHKPCGVSIGPQDTQAVDMWLEKGFDFISCGDDISFIAMGSRAILRHMRGK